MIADFSYESLRGRILLFMLERDWQHKIAKRRGFEQSLLEHSIVCLDVLFTLLPTLKAKLKLSEEEEQALILGTTIHDVAKERDEWQAYITGKGEYKPHVIPEYTVEAVRSLAEWLGFGGEDDARAEANLHMKSVQTAARIFTEAQHAGPRMMLLQRLVADMDNVASANGLLAARDALTRSSLDKYVHTAYHLVHVRGVSTTLLHQAAQMAFEKRGWTPLLFYPTGTLYVRPGAEEPVPVTTKMVQEELAAAITQMLKEKWEVLPALTVGNIIESYLPKPELFDYRLWKEYLRVASTRAKIKTQRKNPQLKNTEIRNVHQYINFSRLLKAGVRPADILKIQGKSGDSLRKQVPKNLHSLLVLQPDDIPPDKAQEIWWERLAKAHPEMATFKFVKELARSELLDEVSLNILEQAYTELFGQTAFEALRSTSTLMPARDQAFTVDFFWALPLKRVAEFLDEPELDREGMVGSLEQKQRVQLLIETLSKIGESAFAAMEHPPTVDNFAQEVAAMFIGDLLTPKAVISDVREFAAQQLEYYKQSKKTIRTKKKAGRICPVCNQPFEQGVEAKADFIGGTSFTSRKFAYDKEGLVICPVCYYERLLRQIILGRKAYDLIVLMPRMNLGRYGGKVLLDKLEEAKRLVKSVATADTADPDETLRLDMTWFVARQTLAADFSLMNAEDLVRLFTYRAKEDTVKKNLKEVIKQAQQMLGSKDLAEARDWWERDFDNWMEVATAIAYKEVDDELAQRIRETVYGLRPPIEFVAQTPNLVLAPSSNPRVSGKSALVDSDKDSDTKAALKQLLIALAFALGLDCSVAILHDNENLDELVLESGGVSYVPPLPSVRNLVARSRSREAQQKLSPAWLSQSEAVRWLRALASAVLLVSKAGYPPRNDLYQILTVRSKGALMRRIEQQGGTMYSEDLQQLEAIGEVLR